MALNKLVPACQALPHYHVKGIMLYMATYNWMHFINENNEHTFLARLNEVQEELLHYCRQWR